MLRRSPQELVQNPNNVRDLIAYDQTRYQELVHKARLLDGLVAAPNVLEFLDDHILLQGQRYAFDVLRDTEPEVVASEYGAEAVVWTAMQEVEEPVFDRQTVVLQKHGYTNDLIRRACLWTRQNEFVVPSGIGTLEHYRFMKQVVTGNQFDQIDLPKLIAAAADKPLSDEVLLRYGLLVLRSAPSFKYVDGPAQWGINTENIVWIDTPVGFVLTYKGEPNAIVGFAPQAQDELMIHQLQGSRPVRRSRKTNKPKQYPSRGIMSFDWRKVMVQISGRVAIAAGFKELSIQQGARNIWCAPRFEETEPHLTHEQAYKAYDAQADRLGFSRGPRGDWHKAAGQIS